MPSIFLPSLTDTLNFGCLLGKHLPSGSTLLLRGNLGSGKTSLVQGIGQGLEIAEPIVSPTFNLINEYQTGRIPLYHLDLYRLDPQQVDLLYPEIYWLGEEVTPGITAIEWSERLSFKPSNYIQIELSNAIEGKQVYLQSYGETLDWQFINNFLYIS